jgi:hypothetical protein
MLEVWKTSKLCGYACYGSSVFAAIVSRREVGCYLHEMLSVEKVVTGQTAI